MLCSPSSPEGDFEVNQLPGDSMGLSPLSSVPTSDLHVSIERRTSTGVSLGFILTEDRSSPFGSYHTHSPSSVMEAPKSSAAWVPWKLIVRILARPM